MTAARRACSLGLGLLLLLDGSWALARYDRGAAIAYASRWCGNARNPAYCDYGDMSGDCINFVSQCLIAGGMNLSDPDVGHRGCRGTYIDTEHLDRYLRSGHATVRWQDRTDIEPGDVLILADCNTRRRYHGVFIRRTEGGGARKRIWIDGHTSNRCNTEYSFGSVCGFYYHITDDCECSAGQTQEDGCGRCGHRSRRCLANCTWDDWGPCQGEGVCAAGATQDEACGWCGVQTRSCGRNCQWQGWGGCRNEGPCTLGMTEVGECGNCGHHERECQADCRWGGWHECRDQGECAAGAQQAEDCGDCGEHLRICSPACRWDAWGGCAGPDPDGGTRVCLSGQPGLCAEGRIRCIHGWTGCQPLAADQPELCDGQDNDCDGGVDEGRPRELGRYPPPLAAELVEVEVPAEVLAGETAAVQLRFRNVGAQPWPRLWLAEVADGPGGVSWYDPTWPGPDQALELAPGVWPGEVAVLEFRVRGPEVQLGQRVAATFQLRDEADALRCPAPEARFELEVVGCAAGADRPGCGPRLDEVAPACLEVGAAEPLQLRGARFGAGLQLLLDGVTSRAALTVEEESRARLDGAGQLAPGEHELVLELPDGRRSASRAFRIGDCADEERVEPSSLPGRRRLLAVEQAQTGCTLSEPPPERPVLRWLVRGLRR